MSTLGNRRRLAHASSKHSVGAFAGAALLDLLERTDAVPRVGSILEKYLEIDSDQHRRLIHQFNQQLLQKYRAGYFPDFFWDRHSRLDADTSLEQYIAEEFMVHTNYQAYLRGQARCLELSHRSVKAD
jgi:hypothetical protein